MATYAQRGGATFNDLYGSGFECNRKRQLIAALREAGFALQELGDGFARFSS